jgi:hypothetical protein
MRRNRFAWSLHWLIVDGRRRIAFRETNVKSGETDLWRNWGFKRSDLGNADPVFKTSAARLYLPAFQICDFGFRIYVPLRCIIQTQVNRKLKLAAQAGVAPARSRLTGGWTTIIRLSNGAAGRILTCIIPLRRRMPCVFDHGSNLIWLAEL